MIFGDPKAARRRQYLRILRRSPLFDRGYYVKNNPGVAASGLSPEEHYLRRGWKQGRNPSRGFSTTGYRDAYADVAASGRNPLIHYELSGRAEGRSPKPFDKDIELVRESEFFDEEYYRFFVPKLSASADAAGHYVRKGAKAGLDPSERFSTEEYLEAYGDVADSGGNPLVHYLRHGRDEGRLIRRGRPRYPTFDALFAVRFPSIQPLTTARVPSFGPRVTVLTDSVNAASLFGGVGTAIILGIELANDLGATFRLATRTDAPDGRVIGTLASAVGVRPDGGVELLYVPEDDSRPFSYDSEDVVITTSWWTTRAVLGSAIPRRQVVYLLQEDERAFYAYGDERLLCGETLAEKGFPVVVNTERLLDHLVRTGLPHLADDGLSFEPAFPGFDGHHADAGDEAPRDGGRRRLFFYSRPRNARNLFWRGAEALSRAVEQNIIDTDRWELFFVGQGAPDLLLPGDVRPTFVEGLPWSEYQALVSSMDAGFVLMDTPHPSYPPLDLARAGAAVLTNRHPGKEDLSEVSKNILMADLAVPSLVEGLGRLVALGADDATRRENADADQIPRDWAQTLAPVVKELVQRLSEDIDVR